ncbi:outer membrane protein transport protein [Hyphobacterium sp. HN65]|uniref:Outer membrane protein transport protein n=1 Tax=Hyphobacterium lacteum TaxID=3116575 RepID=A0ABU7LP92_9PROT|nr:outer membrane protein transport protein [Hyphobacterium sp. HN65]MEE2525738.1 outer membrane protein transport protein [Hyphobacterium sp. HN65]
MSKHLKYAAAMAAVLAVGELSAASATEGYFQHGYGIRQKALGGAGVADSTDAMALSINPAGLVHAPRQFQAGVSMFSPRRGFRGSGGPSFTPSGDIESDSEFFLVPNFAYSRPMSNGAVFAIAAFGNGGMNTTYAGNLANPACMSPPLPSSTGVYCGGATGVNLNQLFISAGYAIPIGDNVSIGIAPVLGVQAFEATGLAAFSFDPFGNPLTTNPMALTNNGTDYATGFGVRFGIEVALADNFRVGASYQTKVNMSEFDDYAGLFEGGGDFDVPANYTIGVAFDITENVTMMFDWRHIEYEGVDAVGNSPLTMAQFGSNGGPGFGWENVDAYKFGIEYDTQGPWTWRAGAAFNNNPIGSSDVTLNILAPGVQTQHYTAGFAYRTSERGQIEFAVMYSPEETVSGIEITPAGPNPGHNIELNMHQYDVSLGWTFTF